MAAAGRGARWRGIGAVLVAATSLSLVLLTPVAPGEAAPTPSTGMPPASAVRAAAPAARAATDTRTVRLSWKGTQKHPTRTASVTVPGAGQLKLICRTDDTMIQLTTSSPAAETQMWLAKHETKGGQDVVAVKTVRLYTYANVDSPATGGSGSRGHEGLNQRSPIENSESGYADGLISRRPGRNLPALGAALAPATSFELTWWWKGFRHRKDKQACQMQLTLRTAPASYGLSWHGDADAATGPDVRSVAIPGLGVMTTTCQTGRSGEQDITLAPAATSGWSGAYVETITGEGDLDDHVDVDDYDLDPTTGLVGPIPLPGNGMLRIFFTVGSARQNVIVSSYVVSNDDQDPDRNLCEVAAAPF